MKILPATLTLLGAVLLSCSDSNQPVTVDLVPLLHVADINFHSPVYTPDSTLPLNQDLPAGTSLSYSHSMIPVTLNLERAGSDLTEIESATLSFRMNIEPQGFSGTCAVTLYLGTLIDVFNDPDALVLSSKKVLPTTFELSSSDRRLLFYLQHEEFYLAYKVVLEPLSLTSRQVSASGVIENLSVEIKGTRGLRWSCPAR